MFWFVVPVAGVISLVGAIVHAIWGPRARARRRLRTGARTLVEGEIVTLVGKVRAARLLEAPLSGRACVGFESIANLYAKNEDNRVVVMPVVERAFTAFEIETKQGVVHVEATREISVALRPMPVIPRSLERERAFLAKNHDVKAAASVASCEESCVLEGDVVAVHGMATFERVAGADERGYRDVMQRARLVAHPEHPLTIGPP
jgi:hypothetical protein